MKLNLARILGCDMKNTSNKKQTQTSTTTSKLKTHTEGKENLVKDAQNMYFIRAFKIYVSDYILKHFYNETPIIQLKMDKAIKQTFLQIQHANS